MFQDSALKIVLMQVLLLVFKMNWWRVLLLNGWEILIAHDDEFQPHPSCCNSLIGILVLVDCVCIKLINEMV